MGLRRKQRDEKIVALKVYATGEFRPTGNPLLLRDHIKTFAREVRLLAKQHGFEGEVTWLVTKGDLEKEGEQSSHECQPDEE